MPAPAGTFEPVWADGARVPGGVASDVVLVLRTDRRRLRLLAQRCMGPSRGLAQPHDELRRALAAHVRVLLAEVFPRVAGREGAGGVEDGPLGPALAEWSLHLQAIDGGLAPDRLPELAEAVLEMEDRLLVPVLDRVPLAERRRLGKAFRIRREAELRSAGKGRRERSRTELYEVARRLGVEQRSRMSHVQLKAAVESWERTRSVSPPAEP